MRTAIRVVIGLGVVLVLLVLFAVYASFRELPPGLRIANPEVIVPTTTPELSQELSASERAAIAAQLKADEEFQELVRGERGPQGPTGEAIPTTSENEIRIDDTEEVTDSCLAVSPRSSLQLTEYTGSGLWHHISTAGGSWDTPLCLRGSYPENPVSQLERQLDIFTYTAGLELHGQLEARWPSCIASQHAQMTVLGLAVQVSSEYPVIVCTNCTVQGTFNFWPDCTAISNNVPGLGTSNQK